MKYWWLEVDSRPVRGVVVCFPHRSAHPVSAVAPATPSGGSSRTNCTKIKGGEREREGGGGGFMALKRMYMICDHSARHQRPGRALAEPSTAGDRGQ